MNDPQPDLPWAPIARWVRLYSWAQVLFLASLVGFIHLLPAVGHPWSSCLVDATGASDWRCVVFFHLYEVPLVAFFAYHLHYGLRRVTRATLPYYTALTLFQVLLLVVFVTFECRTMFEAFAHGRGDTEIAILLAACTGMIVDAVLGTYVAFARLLPAALDARRFGATAS